MLARIGFAISIALVLCFGCGQMHRVSVGSAAQELDLGSCFGEHTDCKAAPDPASATPLDALEPEECAPTEEAPWHVVWQRDVSAVPCPPIGQCRAQVVRLAPDGSMWTAGTAAVADGDGMTEGFFLGHYGKNGEVLVEKAVDSRHTPASAVEVQGGYPNALFPSNAELAVLASGEVVMGFDWTFFVGDPPSLARFDASGRQLGDHIPVLGPKQGDHVRVGPSTDDGLIISTQPSGAGGVGFGGTGDGGWVILAPNWAPLARLDAQLNPVWVQRNGPALSQPPISVDRNGRISAGPLTMTLSDLPPEPSHGSLPLPAQLPPPPETKTTWFEYDAHGNPNAVSALDTAHLWAFDRDGNLLGSRTSSDPMADNPNFTLSKFNARGEALWSRHMPAMVKPADVHLAPAVAPDGTTYVGGVVVDVNSVATSLLYHVDANGENCAFARVNGTDKAIEALYFTPTGELYFSGNFTIGRLAR